MIHNYRRTACAELEHTNTETNHSKVLQYCILFSKNTALIFLTLAILLTCKSASHAFQETTNRQLRPTPDPYFNPKRQEFSSNPTLQQNLTIDNTNPTRRNEKPAPLVDSTLSEKSFAPGKETEVQGVKKLPSWEPPNSGTRPSLESKKELLRPLTPTDSGGSGNQSSIIRNAEKSNSAVVGDFSADLSNFKRLQPSNPDNLKPVPETIPPAPGSNKVQSDFQSSVHSPIAKQPSFQPADDEKAFKPIGETKGLLAQPKEQIHSPKQDSIPPQIESKIAAVESKTSDDPEKKKTLAFSNFASQPLEKDISAEGRQIPKVVNSEIEPTRLLAMVGNEPIFVADMLYEINQMIDKFMPGAPQEIRERETKNAIPMLLGKFVDSKLLYVDTLRKLPEGVDVEKVIEQAGEEFDQKVIKTMMEESGSKTSAELEVHLRVQGTSLRKYRQAWCKDQLTRYFVSQQMEEEKEVTHQQLLDEYKSRLDEYAIPAKARWEQVMIRFDRTSSKTEAEQQIAEIGKKILHGANFAAIAKKESHGFTASDGGQHDWTNKGSLAAEELDKALFSLPIGKLSGIIQTKDGFHIIRVIERTEATHKPFLEAQEEIKESIQEKKRRATFETYVAKVRKEIPVEYYIETPKLPTAQKQQSGTLVR